MGDAGGILRSSEENARPGVCIGSFSILSARPGLSWLYLVQNDNSFSRKMRFGLPEGGTRRKLDRFVWMLFDISGDWEAYWNKTPLPNGLCWRFSSCSTKIVARLRSFCFCRACSWSGAQGKTKTFFVIAFCGMGTSLRGIIPALFSSHPEVSCVIGVTHKISLKGVCHVYRNAVG